MYGHVGHPGPGAGAGYHHQPPSYAQHQQQQHGAMPEESIYGISPVALGTAPMEEQPYFFGSLDRPRAEAVLRAGGADTFLVRESSVKGAYAISQHASAATLGVDPSTMSAQNSFVHTLIQPEKDTGEFVLREAGRVERFSSAVLLVEESQFLQAMRPLLVKDPRLAPLCRPRPLHPDWEPMESRSDGRKYYRNKITGESSWSPVFAPEVYGAPPPSVRATPPAAGTGGGGGGGAGLSGSRGGTVPPDVAQAVLASALASPSQRSPGAAGASGGGSSGSSSLSGRTSPSAGGGGASLSSSTSSNSSSSRSSSSKKHGKEKKSKKGGLLGRRSHKKTGSHGGGSPGGTLSPEPGSSPGAAAAGAAAGAPQQPTPDMMVSSGLRVVHVLDSRGETLAQIELPESVRSVREALERVRAATKSIRELPAAKNCGLFVVAHDDETGWGALTEPSLSLEAYQCSVALGDRYEYKELPKTIAITVHSPSHGVSMPIKCTESDTPGDIMSVFTKKHRVGGGLAQWGLKLVDETAFKGTGRKRKLSLKAAEDAAIPFLQMNRGLSAQAVGHKSTLLFRNRFQALPSEDDKASKKEGKPAGGKPRFGVDPESLPQAEVTVGGQTVSVPSHLPLLRRVIEAGSTEEGVFRLAGADSRMKELKVLISTDEYAPAEGDARDVNECATLMKRWLGQLPTRVFGNASADAIEDGAGGPAEAEAFLDNHCSSAYLRGVYLYVIDLMVQVAQQSGTNRMTPDNLAIVLAPQIVPDDDSQDPFAAIGMNSNMVAVVAAHINSRLG